LQLRRSSDHDADSRFQEFNALADAFQSEPVAYGGQALDAL